MVMNRPFSDTAFRGDNVGKAWVEPKMTLTEAIEIVERWYRGGYATQIADMNPAIQLLIKAGECIKDAKDTGYFGQSFLLPGEKPEGE